MLQLLGGLLFATCMTRPDCAYAVAFLCQVMQDASPQAYDAGLGILAYMYETRLTGITFCGSGASAPKSPVPDVVGMAGLVGLVRLADLTARLAGKDKGHAPDNILLKCTRK